MSKLWYSSQNVTHGYFIENYALIEIHVYILQKMLGPIGFCHIGAHQAQSDQVCAAKHFFLVEKSPSWEKSVQCNLTGKNQRWDVDFLYLTFYQASMWHINISKWEPRTNRDLVFGYSKKCLVLSAFSILGRLKLRAINSALKQLCCIVARTTWLPVLRRYKRRHVS